MSSNRRAKYLQKENWPECIPWTYPKREYGPYPWEIPSHDTEGVDKYMSYHVDAASLGDYYLGDVCPYCGVPIASTETVVKEDGTRGVLHEMDVIHTVGTPVYHPECWKERRAELNKRTNSALDEYL